MEGIALGLMHLEPQVFYALEVRVFDEMLYQFNKDRSDTLKNAWEIARFVTGNLMRPNLKNPNAPLTKVLPMPWDGIKDKINDALDRQAVEEAKRVLRRR